MKNIFILALWLTSSAFAQNWTGVLDPSRAIDWSAINAGVVGGIPTTRQQCGSTIAAGATAATINSAIAACGANQYVQLSAGTYSLSTGIIFNGKSNVTLRGMGANQTLLTGSGKNACDGHDAMICVFGFSGVEDGTTSTSTWTAGYAQGTTQITVASASGLVNGQHIVLSQTNDAADTGGLWVNDTLGVGSIEGVCGPDVGPHAGHCMAQVVKITNIVGSVLTISPGIYGTNYRSGQSPRIWWTSAGGGQVPSTGVGIENLSVDNTTANAYSIISFHNTTNGWVKGIRTVNGTRDHVGMWIASHIEIRDSYFYGTRSAASQSYGIEPEFASDWLAINNIFQHISSPTMMGPSAGAVIAYNFGINNYTTSPATFMQTSYFGSHDAGTHMMLYEGNQGAQALWDTFHGAGGNQITFFRNYLNGWETGKSGGGTVAVAIWANNRAQNIIGNVLGHTGTTTIYESLNASADNAIYNLNMSDWNTCPYQGVACDSKVATTLMRWGNYDTVNAAIRWDATESSPVAVPYVNAQTTPASHTLPGSFFIASKPAWWPSAKAWPAIGPEITTGNVGACSAGTYSGSPCTATSQCSGGGSCSVVAAGHVISNPAMDCYLASGGVPDGTNAVLAFNADTCYPVAVSAPNPPTNLTVIVH